MRRWAVVLALCLAACPDPDGDHVPTPPPGSVTDADLADLLRHFAAEVEDETKPSERAAKLATLAMAYQANSFDTLAETCYRRALAERPGEAKWWYLLAFVLERQDRYDEAVAAAKRAEALVPDYPPLYRSLAFWALSRGKLADAEIAARRAVELSNGGAGALIALGRVQLEAGLDAEAAESFAQAIANWPADWGNSGYAHFLHGNALRRLGREGEALRELALGRGEPTPLPDPWRAEVAGFRAGFEADMQRAHHLVESGRVDEAIPALQELRERRPKHRQVLTDLGTAYLYQSRWGEAIAVLEECVTAHPDAVDPALQLARALWAAGRREEAMRRAQHVVDANPLSSDAFEARGMLHLRGDRAGEALADFDTAGRLDPASATPPALAGAANLALERWAAAQSAFDRALTIDPSQATAIAGSAIVAVRRGDLAAADRLLGRIERRPAGSATLVAEARAARAAAGQR